MFCAIWRARRWPQKKLRFVLQTLLTGTTAGSIISDRTLLTKPMDLSGAAEEIKLWYPPSKGKIVHITVIVTEATSADTGIQVHVTTVSKGGGKTGASKVMLQLEWVSLGES